MDDCNNYSTCNSGRQCQRSCKIPPVDYTQMHPIAMAYVPMQKWHSIYDPSRAFNTGTIFKELDLPFRGGKRRC